MKVLEQYYIYFNLNQQQIGFYYLAEQSAQSSQDLELVETKIHHKLSKQTSSLSLCIHSLFEILSIIAILVISICYITNIRRKIH